MASSIFSRIITTATGAFQTMFYGESSGLSMPMHRLGHDVDQAVDDDHPLQTKDVAVKASVDGAAISLTAINTATGSKADATATDTVSQWSVIALLRGLFAKFSALDLTTAALTTWVDSAANEMGKAANAVVTGLVYNLTTPSPADGAALPQGNSEGRLKVSSVRGIPGTPWSYAGVAGGIINNTAVALVAAQAGTLRNYISKLWFMNFHATVGTEIVVLDGATVIWRGRAPAVMNMTAEINFDPPLRTTAATALNVQLVTTGSSVVVSAQGWVAP